MTEYQNARKKRAIRHALEELEAFNNPQNDLPKTLEGDGYGGIVDRPVTARDLQEMNYDDICNLCDLLGMSGIYMGGKKK